MSKPALTTKLESRKSNRGRDTTITAEIVAKLQECFHMDDTVTMACREAKISTDAFYRRMRSDPEFRNEMLRAKSFIHKASRRAVARQIVRGDGNLALNWLKHREPEIYHTQVKAKISTPKFTVRFGAPDPLPFLHVKRENPSKRKAKC